MKFNLLYYVCGSTVFVDTLYLAANIVNDIILKEQYGHWAGQPQDSRTPVPSQCTSEQHTEDQLQVVVVGWHPILDEPALELSTPSPSRFLGMIDRSKILYT